MTFMADPFPGRLGFAGFGKVLYLVCLSRKRPAKKVARCPDRAVQDVFFSFLFLVDCARAEDRSENLF